ncbi:hypothetical protein [Congregibacter litoralis]|uniref:Uncharacterized protein n=1 Tax=Congregibacter litoralis KT71 TaxID=314285 RepID=A4ABH1_9GAMM|nr:hypothetical protein [Congregibacter litoralis]EAQ96725.1 hypothetical protein KT71_06869 [Congregibacter litoralis KT71]
MKKQLIAASFALALSGHLMAQEAPGCDDLVWSAQVLAANPDIALSCQGVYARNDELYAKVIIELTRVRGNRLSFRPRHTDGSQGAQRSITVDSSWRANIQGRDYRASELLPGQELSVYIPEDRFALAVDDGAFDGDETLINIEEATVVTMPKTASPLYAALAAGVAFLGLGVAMTTRRRLRRARA